MFTGPQEYFVKVINRLYTEIKVIYTLNLKSIKKVQIYHKSISQSLKHSYFLVSKFLGTCYTNKKTKIKKQGSLEISKLF